MIIFASVEQNCKAVSFSPDKRHADISMDNYCLPSLASISRGAPDSGVSYQAGYEILHYT